MNFNIPSLDQDNIYINNGHHLQYFIKQNDYIIKLENEIEEAFKEHMLECGECNINNINKLNIIENNYLEKFIEYEEYEYKIYQDMIDLLKN